MKKKPDLDEVGLFCCLLQHGPWQRQTIPPGVPGTPPGGNIRDSGGRRSRPAIAPVAGDKKARLCRAFPQLQLPAGCLFHLGLCTKVGNRFLHVFALHDLLQLRLQ